MKPTATCIPVVLFLSLSGCYLSHADLSDGGDGGADRADSAADRADDGRDADSFDGPPPEWRFTDRNVPDLSIPVRLYFAAVPAVAWNGDAAGLVYHGREPGADERLAFIPLDARGNPTGPERTLEESRGLPAPIPQIAADGAGFVATYLDDRTSVLQLLRLRPSGEVVGASAADVPRGTLDPLAPPVVLDDGLLAAVPDADRLDLVTVFRFPRSDARPPERFEVRPGEDLGGGPFVLGRGPGSNVALLFYGAEGRRVLGEEYTAGLVRTSTPVAEVPLPFDWMDLVAARADDPYLFVVGMPESGGTVRVGTWSAARGLQVEEFRALLAGIVPAADGDPRPAWGVTFTLIQGDRWRVGVVAAAEPVPGVVVRFAGLVDDGITPDRIDDVPRSSIAWTGNGFLVVWDEWRAEAAAYGLYASYLELHPVP